MESRVRSMVKAVIWTLIGVATMTLVGVAATGSVALGGTMAAVNAVLGLLSYLVYERIWAHVRWGRDV
ncbi:DUF2061 domain-containing protein [Pukyongiella litopenaei]|uniref:DUF2061 domain-containing protein n=1 Tax=Pukyongiella litopenaei TaxID=2605946 RepID=A0A2S0MMH4_9RHOB|nr:DUF2061 domain-containing protein [Pukyongiella litopenaei]AVO37027.1 DUF2061 domain-containing protein [Pukyongiella litopenaei]